MTEHNDSHQTIFSAGTVETVGVPSSGAVSEPPTRGEVVSTTRPSAKRVLWGALAGMCAVVLVVGMAWTAGVWSSDPSSSVGSAVEEEYEVLPPADEFGEPVRALPLRSAADPIGQAFPNGLDSVSAVTDVMSGLVEAMGGDTLAWGDMLPWVRARGWPEQLSPEPSDDSYWYSYPFRYASLDASVDALLDAETVETHQEVLMDLTALLILSEGEGNLDQDEDERETWGTYFRSAGAIAYSILRRAQEVAPTCDLQTQLVFLLSVAPAHAPIMLNAMRSEIDKAESLCSGDPTVLWISAQWYAGQTEARFSELAMTPQEALAGALDSFAVLQEEFPDLALGYAGMADMLLLRATNSEVRGMRPFSVRQWRQQALRLYEQARSLSDDPGLLPGHARAMLALGRADEAETLMGLLPESAADLDVLSALRLEIALAKRDYALAQQLVSESRPDRQRDPLRWGRAQGYGGLFETSGSVDLGVQGGGGADAVSDVAFIPQYRYSHPGDGPWMGSEWSELYYFAYQDDYAGEDWFASVAADLQVLTGTGDGGMDYEHQQDVLRWAEDYAGAAGVVRNWEKVEGGWRPIQRSGEIAYLSGAYEWALKSLKEAASICEQVCDPEQEDMMSSLTSFDQLRLQIAATHQAMDDDRSALRVLASVVDDYGSVVRERIASSDDGAVLFWEASAMFYADSTMGEIHLAAGRDQNAVNALRESVAIGQWMESQFVEWGDMDGEAVRYPNYLRGAQENNLALALARLGEANESIEMAEAALARDPASPIFIDTLAFSYQMAGRDDEAVEAYRNALDADATSYISANNLAVILGGKGEWTQARDLLRQSVAAAPDYAIGWHNLGVVEAHVGGVFTKQAAFALSARIDRQQRDYTPDLILDNAIHDANLDVSKMLAPDWSFAQSSTPPRHGFTISMAILLVVVAVGALFKDKVSESVTNWILSTRRTPTTRKPAGSARNTVVAGLAVAVAVGVLSWDPAVWSSTWVERFGVVVLVAATVLLPLALRHAMAEPQPTVTHAGSLPAVGVGVVGIGLGLAVPSVGVMLAPHPGMRTGSPSTRLRWLGLVCVAVVTVAWVMLAWGSAVPIARFMAQAGALLLASMLLPVGTFDGAHIKSRWAELGFAIALGVLTVAFAWRWV